MSRLIVLTVCAFVTLWSSGVRADAKGSQSTIKLKNGDRLTGTLVEYVPDAHVVLELSVGGRIVLPIANVDRTSIPRFATIHLSDGRSGAGLLIEYVERDHLVLKSGSTNQVARYDAWMFRAVTFSNDDPAAPVTKAEPSRVEAPKTTPPAAPSPANARRPLSATAPEFNTPSVARPEAAVIPAAATAHSDESPPTVAQSDAVKAVAVQQLLTERADWANRNTSIALPLGFTLGGAGVIVLGLGILGAGEKTKPTYLPAGITLGIGGVATLVGVMLYATRTSESEQQTQLLRIDQQLQQFGVKVSLAPWLLPVPRATASGLNLHVSF